MDNNINILIVEDDPIIAADLEDRLQDMGYHVIGAFDTGEAAFAALDTAKPDLILMDIQLAGLWNGIETTQHMAAKGNFFIIYLTSNSDDVTFKQAKQMKPAAFLSKPFRGRDLKHAIELAIVQSNQQNDKGQDKQIVLAQAVIMDDRLFIKHKDQLDRVFFNDILWVEADDYYCKVITPSRELLITQSLSKFSEKLANRLDFYRVHRSYLVNLKHIEQIGDGHLLIGKKRIPISQSAKSELLQRLKTI